MIAIDTNVIVRIITNDDSVQASKAFKFLQANISSLNPAIVTLIVLCELVWVLSRAYKYSKEEIIIALRAIMNTKEFYIENSETAMNAINKYEKGNADFSDYIILEQSMFLGAEKLITFDSKAAKEKGFKIL